MVHKFIQSNRGKKVLVIDGYLYRINYRNNENNKTYWKCKTNGCRTSAITENEQLNSSRGEHNHGPDGNEISKKLFIEKAKKAISKEPLKTIPCVYQEQRTQHINKVESIILPEQSVFGTPELKSVKATLYRAKRKVFPHCPNNIQDVIKGMWSTTLEGRRFLLGNDVSGIL